MVSILLYFNLWTFVIDPVSYTRATVISLYFNLWAFLINLVSCVSFQGY